MSLAWRCHPFIENVVPQITRSAVAVRTRAAGAEHYLGNVQTLELMQSQYLHPEIPDRDTPGAWEETGRE